MLKTKPRLPQITLKLISLISHSFHSPLFDPEAFHIENYTELPDNVGVSFINKKPRYLAGLDVNQRFFLVL